MTEGHSKKESAAPQGVIVRETHLAPALYLVATPIGNLRDITLRALDVLSAADHVFCEDTRVSKKLLSAYGISKRLEVYHDHSDERVRERIISLIRAGETVALISDAGMPLISDPGYKLVRDAALAGVTVNSVPGANAPLAAMQVSGLPSDCFTFIGFLPSKQKARHDVLKEWTQVPATLVAFETASRLLKALADIDAVMGGRPVAVVREITKLYEEARRGSAVELLAHYEEHGAPKGEIVIVISPPEQADISGEALEALLRTALADSSTKEAAAQVALETGKPRKELYEMALKIISKDDG